MYSDPTATLLLLPGLPQTATVSGYTATVVMITSQTVRADSYIDADCSKRYSIPLNAANTSTAAVPPLVRTISADLASAWTYRAYYPKDSAAVNEWPEQFIKAALERLKLIREGEIDLTDTAGSLLVERDEATKIASSTPYPPDFGHGDAVTWLRDSEKLSDEADDRA